MAPSNEDNVVSVLQLKNQLKATFGCAGNGSMNIAELYKLLENFIAIHARYEDDRKDLCPASDLLYLCSKETSSKEFSSSSAIEKTNKQSEDSLSGKTETEGTGLLECSKNTSCDEVSAEIKDIELPTPRFSKGEGERIDQRVHDDESSGKGQEREMLPGNDKIESSKRVDVGPRTNIPSSSTSVSQRSSDFNVKSTSSMSTSSSLRKCNEEYSGDTNKIKHLEPSVNPNVVEPVSDKTLHSSQEIDCSKKLNLPFETTETSAKDDFHYSISNLVGIMEGCKKHLETVKQEVLTLKIRCQSQYDDTLKLAGGLDDLAKRFRDQEPMVRKLEKDMHCLGMLVSDYEWNFSSIKKGIDRNDAKAKDFDRFLQRSDKELNAIRGELRTVSEQMNHLSNEKADKLAVQTGLDQRALITDLLKHVTYEEFNGGFRELANFVTQVREEQYALEETMKTVQYELVKGLDAKASTQDVCQIRHQLVGVLGRWQKAQSSAIGDSTTQLIRGNFRSAAVTLPGSMSQNTVSSTCLTCGVQTILEGDNSVVPVGVKLIPAWKANNHTRNAGGFHTTSAPPERVFRTGNISMAQKMFTKNSSRNKDV